MSFQKIMFFLYLNIAVLISTCCIASSDQGFNFINDALLVYRVITCGHGPVQDAINIPIVENHCRNLQTHYGACRTEFIEKARPFIAALRPHDLPRTVIYPFGGSDLLSALATYPDATDITTISLEGAGDPRRLRSATPEQLRQALSSFRPILIHLLRVWDNQNEGVRQLEKGIVPNQLAFSLAAAHVYGYEPESLKYFIIEPDGALHYLTQDEISGSQNKIGKRLWGGWVDPDYPIVFRNMELVYRKHDQVPGPDRFIHRHIAWNLQDRYFSGSPLQQYLESKGRISAITKAASYLLWRSDFSSIRNYLLSHMDFMVSDSTGILPRHAGRYGFEQVTYGRFNGAFLDNQGGPEAAELRDLWKSQPYRPMPFRYGYSDIYGASHMIITQPKKP